MFVGLFEVEQVDPELGLFGGIVKDLLVPCGLLLKVLGLFLISLVVPSLARGLGCLFGRDLGGDSFSIFGFEGLELVLELPSEPLLVHLLTVILLQERERVEFTVDL